jgi:hypothetical protein
VRHLFVFLTAALTLSLASSCSDDTEQQEVGPRSFEKNVMPILSVNCSLQACHGSKESNLGILITADKAQVFGELQKSSPTFGGGALKFVVAGDANKSFLMRKMDGNHSSLAGCGNGCGKEMPPEALLSAGKRETIRRWINEGAKNN